MDSQKLIGFVYATAFTILKACGRYKPVMNRLQSPAIETRFRDAEKRKRQNNNVTGRYRKKHNAFEATEARAMLPHTLHA